MKEIIERLKSDYAKLKSLTIKEGDGCILLSGVRYKGYSNAATIAQVRYLQGMDNVDYYSTSNLMKGNKWFMSACIEIAKAYPETNFKVVL
jgi:hypothetical protein